MSLHTPLHGDSASARIEELFFVFSKSSCIFLTVRAVLKKREYGAKYTQNNFITAVRAMNEFCLKPRWPFDCILPFYASFINCIPVKKTKRWWHMSLKVTLFGFAMLSRSAACKPNHKCLCLMSNRAFVISWCWTVCRQLSWSFTDLFCCPSPKYVCSDLEQLRKIRRRSPHDDTEAFTVFLRSDVEAKLVVLHIN